MVTQVAKNRRRAFEQQGGVCFWCRSPMALIPGCQRSHHRGQLVATGDHLIPKSRGGTGRVGNIVATCKPCNNSRGNMPLAMWLIILRETLKYHGRLHHFAEVLSSLRERGIHAVTQVGHPGNGPDTQTAKVPPPTDERPAP